MELCSAKSVGAIIKKQNEFLLIDRRNFPYGWACVAGHVDEGETPGEAIRREVQEELGLKVRSAKLILKENVSWNKCSKGTPSHYWHVFQCSTEGEILEEVSEVKSAKWIKQEDIVLLELEPVWKYFLKKLGYIP